KENERFLAWIMRISHNLAMDYFRKYSRENLEDISSIDHWDQLSTNKNPSKELSIKEIGENLNQCIEKLPTEQKEVFLFRYDELPFKEIARLQKCSINTALARMQYALKSLRNCLKNRRAEK
ncbi:MAG TPA: sigma-70 family RNA polymerase sigma factor, partial [Victivallales bacterium]|nr:sigma-70 family RNA polymerase sigma factor [Victivallales bacterium]